MKYKVIVTKYTAELEETIDHEKTYKTERNALLYCINNFKFAGGKWQKWDGDVQYVAEILPTFE